MPSEKCLNGWKIPHGCSAQDGRDILRVSASVSQPRMIKVIWPTGETAAHCAADSLEIILYQQKRRIIAKKKIIII